MPIPLNVIVDGEPLQFQAVSSSNIACVAWSDRTQRVYVRFHNGGLYRYSAIPKAIYSALLLSPSKGSYFHRYIKGVYPSEKLE